MALGVTVAYLGTAALVAFGQSPRSVVWGALLVLLAVERQMSIGSSVGEELRRRARDFGWYRDRVAIQVTGTTLVVLLSIAAVAAVAVRLRRGGSDLMVIAGIGALVALGAIRLLSLHPIDRVLGYDTFGVSIRVASELVLLLFIGLSAVVTARPRHVSACDTA